MYLHVGELADWAAPVQEGPPPVRARRIAPVALALSLHALAACTGDDRPVVQTAAVAIGDVTQTVSAPARVDAAARQDVAAGVSGTVSAIGVPDGGTAGAGQIVVRIASPQVDLAVQQAAAAQEAAGAGGGITVAGTGDATRSATRQQVVLLDQRIRPSIADARVAAEAVADPVQRAAAHAAVDAVEQSYADTRAALLAAGEGLAAQQDAVAASISGALGQALDSAAAPQQAQAAAAAAAVERQRQLLVAAAPFAGTVRLGSAAAAGGAGLGDLAAASGAGGLGDLAGLAGALGGGGSGGGSGGGTLRVGAPITAGLTLFTVYDLSTVYVVADVDEVDAPQIRAGQAVTVLVDAFPDARFRGVVETVAVEGTTTAAGGVGYPSRVRISGEEGGDAQAVRGLKVGMTASAEIATRTATDVLTVPSRALLRRDDTTVVFVARDGRVAQVAVTVATLGEDLAAVTGDLAEGDRVAVSGYEDVADGDEVRVERAATSPAP